ncbi:MAG: hypothetical protein H7Y10_02830 [Flavobacterium sp.]|nr:hypothetical protein [Flavobacterium sp.]
MRKNQRFYSRINSITGISVFGFKTGKRIITSFSSEVSDVCPAAFVTVEKRSSERSFNSWAYLNFPLYPSRCMDLKGHSSKWINKRFVFAL